MESDCAENEPVGETQEMSSDRMSEIGDSGDRKPSAPPTFPWSHCNPKDAPENKYLVERLIPERGCHLVLGPPKSGKSQLLAHIAACFLAGEPVFGHYALSVDAEYGGPTILYILTEENRFKVRERVEANLRGFGMSDEQIEHLSQGFDERISISSRDKTGNRELADTIFSVEEHKSWFLDEMRLRKYSVGVVDSLRPAHSFEENSSTAMKPVTDMMREISDYGCVLVIHHTGHASHEYSRVGGDAGRGSSDLDAARDTAIHIKKGKFGSEMLIGFHHRDDAELYVAVKTEVERNPDTTRWIWIGQSGAPGIASNLLEEATLFERIDAAKNPEDLPSLSEMKPLFGNDYRAFIGTLEQEGIVECRTFRNGQLGKNPTLLMRPGQFTDEDWTEAEKGAADSK